VVRSEDSDDERVLISWLARLNFDRKVPKSRDSIADGLRSPHVSVSSGGTGSPGSSMGVGTAVVEVVDEGPKDVEAKDGVAARL